MTYTERARKVLEQMEQELRKQGIITTALYESGRPILVKAFKELVKSFEQGNCPAVESVKKAVPDMCQHCKRMVLFAIENEE